MSIREIFRRLVGPKQVIGTFVAGEPASRCIVDRQRYVAHWSGKYGRKLRRRVLEQVEVGSRVTDGEPILHRRLRKHRPANYGGSRVVALPSVTARRVDELREQLSDPVFPLAAAVRHTRRGAVYAALEVDDAHP